MANITAAAVKSLREQTGLPMMECKAALTEASGDTEQAKNILQKKYKGKMASRATHVTGEGRVGIYIRQDGKCGALAELRCETAPVAKTECFIQLADGIAKAPRRQRGQGAQYSDGLPHRYRLQSRLCRHPHSR